MRLNINLASRKYEDVRQFFVRWGLALAVLAGLSVMLATLTALSHSRSVKAGREIKDLQQRVAALQKQRDELRAYEDRPENRGVTLERKFWNTQIARRNLSWTQLFNDLQKIMPDRAYLNSVQPELTPDNHLKLKLVIAGEKREDARELLKRMEDSARFHAPRLVEETVVKGKPVEAPTYKFLIETEYAPASAVTQPESPQRRQGQGAPLTETSGTKEAS